MKKLILLFAAICCAVLANAQQTPPDNRIWYTSSDGMDVTPHNQFAFNTPNRI